MRSLCEYYIGIDIGGTNVRCVLVNDHLNIIGSVHRTQFKRFNSVEEEVNENVCSLIEIVLSAEQANIQQVKSIGVSLAALINRDNGYIAYWPNNKLWDGFPLKEYLQKKYNVPIFFEDDANSAAFGEFFFGAAKGFSNFAYITISTGIGCGLVLNGEIFSGSHGWAGEIGHTKVQDNGLICKCGAIGCLQTLASGPALLERAKELSGYCCNVEFDDLSKVVKLAIEGEPWAIKLFQEAGKYLADALSNVIMLLDIPLIVIGGGVASAGEVLLEPLEDSLKSNLVHRKRDVIVKLAECGDNSGVLGVVAQTYHLIQSSQKGYDCAVIGGYENMCIKKKEINIGIVNGPNINMLGKREPQFYGNESWDCIEEKLKYLSREVGANLLFFQSNHEGEIVDFIQKNIDLFDGIVINPAAYTKNGYAILDALTSVSIPYIEVHLSNIFSRGGWHSESIFAQNAIGHVIGFKGYVYELGLRAIMNHINVSST